MEPRHGKTSGPSRAATRGVGRSITRSILRGELDRISLATLLTLLDLERRDGILILQRGRQLGRLFVSQGRVMRANLEGGVLQSGTDAIFSLLAWKEGQFELWQAEVDATDEIAASTTFLLMEAARRQDEGEAAHGAQSIDLSDVL